MKELVEKNVTDFKNNSLYMIKWIVIATILGVVCGVVGAAFHHAVDYVTELRLEHEGIILLFPVGGVAIVGLYNLLGLKDQPGTDTILESVRLKKMVPVLLAPAIFLATVITHFVGGSSGREGAALQIGGSIATSFGKLIKANEKEVGVLVMCGMTAVFSALFGTPVTATIFALEVVSVGVIYYASLVPCLFCGLTAFSVAMYLGCSAVRYTLKAVLVVDPLTIVKLVAFALMIALVSIAFVSLMHETHHLFEHYFKNAYVRIIVGSIIMILMIIAFGRAYLGAGMNVVESALYDKVNWYDFILKALFTAVTIGCGFKGGEIVPTFFIGATFGYVAGSILGIDPHIGAMLGMVGLFCCVVNAPIASLMLALEIFGMNNFIPFILVIAISFVMSDYYSLYHSQRFVYSKTKTLFIDRKAK